LALKLEVDGFGEVWATRVLQDPTSLVKLLVWLQQVSKFIFYTKFSRLVGPKNVWALQNDCFKNVFI
jgi:hypothetical protein